MHLKIGWEHSLVVGLPSRNHFLATAVKSYAKAAVRVFCSCPGLIKILPLPNIKVGTINYLMLINAKATWRFQTLWIFFNWFLMIFPEIRFSWNIRIIGFSKKNFSNSVSQCIWGDFLDYFFFKYVLTLI